jgi:nucleoid-associated protein YgaU
LVPEIRTVAFLELPESKKPSGEVSFAPEPSSFEKAGASLVFAIPRAATVQPSGACLVHKKSIEASKFFQSCANPQIEYVVQKGDSMWRVADKLYGEGQFFHVVESLNHSPVGQTRPLLVGRKLKVAPFYQLAGDDEVIVTAGDSLWRIAEKRLHNPLLYKRLMLQNRDKVQDPLKLYTLLPLSVAKK